ncbi:putative secreted protein [Rhodopirellula maiorica SM1]|uniref:Putative secreted protein n=1 Tax=Rhodopirellula maiorica SM1 TaxID=1265738 RepID=M5RQ60_9BACT|nr:ThuA domain-containing protein [Rhodopirellula maiorica]EMI17527.1 putative secreted protein [Rhodopirellula maiorica SM1]
MMLRTLLWLLLPCCVATTVLAEQPHVVLLIAEQEYETDQTLPEFVEQNLKDLCHTTLVHAKPDDKNTLVGIEAVKQADVLLVSVRRRALPTAQLDLIRDYVASGKPVIGIRTANHAFSLRKEEPPAGHDQWIDWDAKVFGGSYTNHYGNNLKAKITFRSDDAIPKTLLDGIRRQPFIAGGSLYKVAPLAEGAVVLMDGKVEGQGSEPVAWTFTRADGGKSFYTSLGHRDDFAGDVLPTLLKNAIRWSLEDSNIKKE